MSKTIINLDKWGLLNYREFICAFGIADNHPKLGNNVQISHTSEILKVEEKEDTYYFETHNSIYVCKLGNISDETPYDMSETKGKGEVAKVYDKYYKYKLYNLAKENNEPISKYRIILTNEEKEEFERILELTAVCNKERAEKEKLQDAKLIEEALKYKNCIFIDLSSISTGSKAAFNINGRTGVIKPYVHLGMCTDTVIYENLDEINERISLRYYVRYCGADTYSWSENIEKVVIHNNKKMTIRFNNIEIEPDETIEILRKDIYK